MTASQRFTLIMFGLGVLVGLIGWGLRMLWNISAGIQETKDTTSANSKATAANTASNERLTTAVNQLTERVARLEGPRRR